MQKSTLDIPLLVKTIRRARGITQEGLARKLGVTFATVNSWENGRRLPQPFLLQRLLQLEKRHTKK